MFPSSGLFAHINCPFAERGLCERPHCFYKHGTDSFGGKTSSVVDLAGEQYGGAYAACGAPVNDESADNCFHELEKLNKEIETVRHEVEQERRRLSCYQTLQTNGRNDGPKWKSETSGSYRLPLSKDHKTREQARKYVVDNSKPRTDLEYDPLSNFSAALHSYSSSGKEHKVKNKQDIKHSNQKKTSTPQAQMYHSSSPELLDESNEDDVLIIDVPLSEKTSAQAQKSETILDTSVQDDKREVKEGITALLDSPQLNLKSTKVVNVAASSALRDETNKVGNSCAFENDPPPPTCEDDKEYKPVDGREVELTKCLESLESFNSAEMVEELSETFLADDSLCCKPQAAKSPLLHRAAHGLAAEQPAQDEIQIHWGPVQSSPSVVHRKQKMLNKMPEKMQEKSTVNQDHEAGQNSQSLNVSSVNPRSRADPSESPQQLLKTENEAVIIIDSSPEEEEEDLEEEVEEEEKKEELNYSEMEISDSDPMEECYRIFMEAKNEDEDNEKHPDMSIKADISVEKQTVNSPFQALPGKKRVAHEARCLEQPLAKSRPQPQVLVPLREPAASGFGSRPSITSKIQQVQQRASILTASVKAGQAFVSCINQKKPETLSAPSVTSHENLQPTPVPNPYLNYIPLGTAVIEVGNNLHLILPQGSFPLSVAANSSPVTSVLTPVSHVHPSPVTIKQASNPPTVNPLLRYHPAAPVLIAAPPRRPALSTALHSTAATSQPAVQAAAKAKAVKRKLKQHSEAVKDKVPHDVRQRYVNMFTEEILKTTPNVHDAFDKALAEEKSIYSRSVNKLKYLSIAVNALKRLKNQSTAAKHEEKTQNQRPKGNIPFNRNKLIIKDDTALYESLKDYVLTDERMIENNYPVQHPEKPGCAVLFADKKTNADPLKRICCRCGATYSVSQTGKHIRKEECTYHYGRGVENRVPGGVETRYSCCQAIMGAPGCQVFKLHVHDSLSLDGFVSTASRRPSDASCPGVYSLDCEMCYTVQGLELSRVTVVNSNLQVIYDTFVRPDNDVIDLNTRFSGISEEDVKDNHTSLREIQETLLSFISADTILVGHGLETDLCLLKLLHGMVVDTSVVFPHRLGPPNKLSLNSLTAEYLRRIIQESVCGHDTAEDAAACMELLLWKMKEDGKLKK